MRDTITATPVVVSDNLSVKHLYYDPCHRVVTLYHYTVISMGTGRYKIISLKKSKKQAQLGVPHSRTQV